MCWKSSSGAPTKAEAGSGVGKVGNSGNTRSAIASGRRGKGSQSFQETFQALA